VTEQEAAARMQELLTYANHSKVGRAIGVSRTTVSEWAKGRDVTPYRLTQVEQLLGPPPVDIATRLQEVLAAVADAERRVISEVRQSREALYDTIADQLVREVLPGILEELNAEQLGGTEDPPPDAAGRPQGPPS
jgi:transcriptional regulator with XRE-family HTH domain